MSPRPSSTMRTSLALVFSVSSEYCASKFMRRVCGQTRLESMRFHFAPREIADIILPRMNPLSLHEFHHGLRAQFTELNGAEVVADYGDWLAEHAALRKSAGVI